MVNGDKRHEPGYPVNGLNPILEIKNQCLPVSGTVQSAASGVAVNGFAAGKQDLPRTAGSRPGVWN